MTTIAGAHSPQADAYDPSSRIFWLDYAKGIAIILVVIGHVLRGLRPEMVGERIETYGLADEFIYSFHMPLFFFIAGFLFDRRSQATVRVFLRSLAIGLVVPYIIWSIVYVTLQKAAPDRVNHLYEFGDLLAMYWRPIGHMWFLPALIVAELAFYAGRKALGRAGVFALAAFFAVRYLTDLDIPPDLYPGTDMGGTFVGLGLVVALLSLQLPKSVPALVAWLIGSAAVWFVTVFYRLPRVPFLFLDALIAAVTGIAMAVVVAHMIPAPRTFATKLLAQLGEASLAIFVCHTIFAAALRIALLSAGVTNCEVHIIAGTLIGLLAPTALFILASHYRISPYVGFGRVPKFLYLPLSEIHVTKVRPS